MRDIYQANGSPHLLKALAPSRSELRWEYEHIDHSKKILFINTSVTYLLTAV